MRYGQTPLAGLPERVTIYEVGPRDGLQNESARACRSRSRRSSSRRLVDAGLPIVETTSFVHPQVGAAARRRRGPAGRDRARARACGTRCWCRTSAASTGRWTRACATSRSSAARPRRSRSATSTGPSTSRSRCSSPVVRRAREAGPRRPRLRLDVLRRPVGGRGPGRAGGRRRQAGCSTSAAAELSLGDTIGVGHARPRRGAARRASPPPGSRPTGPRGALPRHLRPGPGQHPGRAARAASPPSTPAPAASAAAPTPRAPPATSPPRTWSGCSTGSASSTGVDLDELVATSTWMAGQLGRPSPSRTVTALAGATEGEPA